jgi:uncharacterized membrane protein YczE
VTRRPLAWVRLLAGLWLFAAGVVGGLRSGLGVSPWDVLHDGIRRVTPLSFGVATVLVGLVRVLIEASVLAVGWLLGGAVGIGTVLFTFGIGPTVELAFRLLRVQVPAGPDRPASGRERTCAES